MQLLATLALASLAAASGPTVYLIRHGEKPSDSSDHGLSAQGLQRAQCLRSVFGADSQYNIDYIMAEQPESDGSRTRPLDTVQPLATDLGIEVDTSCSQKDEKCVRKAVNNYSGNGNILICWEHKELNNIAEELGADNVDNYPDDSFNLIWTDPSPYDEIVSITSENCPGLDD